MKIVQINRELLRSIREVALRFPVIALYAIFGFAVGLLVQFQVTSGLGLSFLLLFGVIAGVPLSLIGALIAESRGFIRRDALLIQGAALLLSALYAIYIPKDIFLETDRMYLALSVLILSLLVSVAPYLKTGSSTGFWRYNTRLILQLLVTLFIGAVLWLALYSIFLCLNLLLELPDVAALARSIGQIALIFVILPITFLSGIPNLGPGGPVDRHSTRIVTLRKLLIHSAWMGLLPLTGFLTLALYAHLVVSLLDRSWPSLWIGSISLFCTLLGLLAYFLLYPLWSRHPYGTTKRWLRIFFLVQTPLVLIAILTITRRIVLTGWIELWYYILLLSIWSVGVMLVWAWAGRIPLKTVPLSLLIVLVLTAIGPWGPVAVSEQSQLDQLREIVEQEDLFVGGSVETARGINMPEAERWQARYSITWFVMRGKEQLLYTEFRPGGYDSVRVPRKFVPSPIPLQRDFGVEYRKEDHNETSDEF